MFNKALFFLKYNLEKDSKQKTLLIAVIHQQQSYVKIYKIKKHL